jgi:hypothetical protein
MTQNYAQTRIRTALKENPGSAAKARQAVMRAALEDPKLMAELVAPHLSGIVAYAIARVEQGDNPPESLAPPEEGKPGSFGLELLRHVADDNAAVFGQESNLIPGKKAAASQGHIDAINMLASKSKTKK